MGSLQPLWHTWASETVRMCYVLHFHNNMLTTVCVSSIHLRRDNQTRAEKCRGLVVVAPQRPGPREPRKPVGAAHGVCAVPVQRKTRSGVEGPCTDIPWTLPTKEFSAPWDACDGTQCVLERACAAMWSQQSEGARCNSASRSTVWYAPLLC